MFQRFSSRLSCQAMYQFPNFVFSHLNNVSIYARKCFISFFSDPTAPGKPGKMTAVFPALEKSWNFIILQKSWKNELSGKKIYFEVKLIVAIQGILFLLLRALPIQMYFWEMF